MPPLCTIFPKKKLCLFARNNISTLKVLSLAEPLKGTLQIVEHAMFPIMAQPKTNYNLRTFRYNVLGSLLIWTKNEKHLPTISSWDSKSIFDIRNINWNVTDQNLVIQCFPNRWRCNHFSKKWPKSNFDTTLI